MFILGINSFFEHPSVSILSDNKVLFAMEDERITGIKGGKRYSPYSIYFPYRTLYAALNQLDLKLKDIDAIAYSYDMWKHLFSSVYGCLTKKRLSSMGEELHAFMGLYNFKKYISSEYDVFHYMRDRINPRDFLNIPFKFYDHHLCHAASAYYFSGFDESLILVADGSGEGTSTSLYVGRGDKIKPLKTFGIPNSLGFLYSFVTKHLGFNPFMDEYKVMGLAPYGRPNYVEHLKKAVAYDGNGHYKVNKKMLLSLEELLGPARKKGEELTDRHKDIASSVQYVLEDILCKLLSYYRTKTGVKNLCMAGGVALNCVANGRIHNERIFDEIFVQPASDDSGTALGAAALLYYDTKGNKEKLSFNSAYLGTGHSASKIKGLLEKAGLAFQAYSDSDLAEIVCDKLREEQIGGVFRGRMEFGPRALGNRSLIASPRNRDMLERINAIKGREMFRPIAPMIRDVDFDEYFEGCRNEYMLFTCYVKEHARARIPAVTHVDHSARVQVVTRKQNNFIYELLGKCGEKLGVPVLVNTSLNFKGEPIIEDPEKMIMYFQSSPLDFLIMENFLVCKS